MKCCSQKEDLYVFRNGKLVPYIPPTEKFRINVFNLDIDIGKALNLINKWDMKETEWNVKQIEYYLKNIVMANMNFVKNPEYSEPNKLFVDFGPFDYNYPNMIEKEKLSTPGILLPKEFIGAKHDIVVDGNHRLIRCFRDNKPIRMKILTEEQYKEIRPKDIG